MAEDTNVEVTLTDVRLSFEHIFKAQVPKPDKDGKVGAASFNASFLIEKTRGKLLDTIEDKLQECKEKKWKDKIPKLRENQVPYKNGDDFDYDGYEGNMVISARNSRAPRVIHSKKDRDGKFIVLDGTEGVIYSGCRVNAIVRFWAQDSADYGKRVNCSLEAVQFYADDTAFSGATQVDADKAFAGLEGKVDEDADADDMRSDRGRRTERESRMERAIREDDDDRAKRSRDADRGNRDREDRDDDRSRRSGRGDDERGGGSRDRGADESRSDRSSSRDRERDRGERDGRRDGDARSSDRSSSRETRGEASDRRGDRDRGREDDRDRSSARRGRDDDDRGDRGRSGRGRSDDLL